MTYKQNKELMKANFPLSVKAREQHFKDNPNTHIKWADYVYEVPKEFEVLAELFMKEI